MLLAGVAVGFGAVAKFVTENAVLIVSLLILVAVGLIAYAIVKKIIEKQRRELMEDVLDFLDLRSIDNLLKFYDSQVTVKSRQTLDNYDDIKFLKENDCFEEVKDVVRMKLGIRRDIESFLENNEFGQRPQFSYVADRLRDYLPLTDGYRARIVYITSAGNNKGERLIRFTESDVRERKKGIQGAVTILRKLNHSDAEIEKAICEQFDLTPEEAGWQSSISF